ncbi:MAG: hypothetical protein JSS20_14955, partial [Proteobacteria bacterium]|nr:hypothetical protein [Pseudomonadota bacterium]
MQYKGDDLDLRVPHGRPVRESYAPEYETSSNGRWGGRTYQAGPVSSEPLWVDEVVLACCNYAFDVAQANGAAEVGLEHLVNALTRVDAAARTLELRGVREGQLRRESAALIASEVPAANAGDAVAPRRSAEFEDVLRRASELGSRRGTAASIDDVLWVLLHYGRDVPVVMLLRRLTPDWQRADWGRVREFAVPEPSPRSMPMVVSDPVHSRMSGLEDSLRLMQSEFTAERKLLMDLVRDIQRDVVAQRGDGAAFRGDLGQRLESLERTMMTRSEVRLPVHFTDRIAALEKAVHGSLGDATRTSRELAQRLASLETAVGEVRALPQLGALAERIVALETSVQSSLSDAARHSRELVQRLAGFETALDAQGGAGPLAERMAAL